MRGNADSPREAVAVGAARTGVEELFRGEYDAMYRLAYTMLATDSDADEVVQDAFFGVAARWDSLDNPGGYLRVSVVNGARKRMRSQSRRTMAETTMRADITTSPQGEGDYLLDVLDGLPDRQRAALVLTYYSGLDANEAGELMDCRPATVRSLVRHALAAMREVVEQ